MREKGQTEAAKTLETPVFSRGIEILTEKIEFFKNPENQKNSHLSVTVSFWCARRDLNPHVRNGH